MNVYLDNDSGLILNKAYTITLAIADTNSLTRFERNGGNGTQLYTASDINLFSGTNSYTFTNVQLSRGILGSNTLDITFTAVPEPSLLFGAAVGLIGLVGVRKKLFKQP